MSDTTGARVFGRLLLAAWLFTSIGFVYTGWRERGVEEAAVVPVAELHQHVGERVRVQAALVDTFALPNGEAAALQAISVWRYERANRNAQTAATRKHQYDRAWPPEVRAADGTGHIRVLTAGVQPRYMARVLETDVVGGAVTPEVAGQIVADLIPAATGFAEVFLIRPGERVEIIGTVAGGEVPTIRTAPTAPLIISNFSSDALRRQAQASGGLKLALGATLFLFGFAVWRWLRAGLRREINGVAIYPLEVRAARAGGRKAGMERALNQLLTDAGVDPAEYHRQRRRAKRTALALLLACPVLFVILLMQLGVFG